MSLLNLPIEILIIIIHHLDLVSLYNLYNTCGRLRQIIGSFGDIKICNLSMSTMATSSTLKLDFFNDICRSIQELNLCGITDLNKKALISSARKLKCLKTLNISYTNINIADFIEIYQVCPSIKHITINLNFTNNTQIKLPKKLLMQSQEIFKNLEIVNFIGTANNILYSQVPSFILNKAKLKALTYTVSSYEMVTYENEECDETLHFDEFCLNFFYGLNPIESYRFHLLEMYVFSTLNFEEYESIIIYKLDSPKIIYATPIFHNFFKQQFDFQVDCLSDFSEAISGNSWVALWNKNTTIFDEGFFKRLSKKLQLFLPICFKSPIKTLVAKDHDWYCTVPTQDNDLGLTVVNELGFKRQRNVQPNYVLNYDKQFQDKSCVQLSLQFDGEMKSGVTLSAQCDYLRKLTYLNLSGVVRYSADFFNILFRCCNQLTTLNVVAPSLCSCFASISRSIPLSQSLKNIRLVDKRIDFELMFSSMSQCKTLENVNICDTSSDTFNLTDPFIMFKKCQNLYCLYVFGPVSDTGQSKKLKILNAAKVKSQKSYLRVKVFNNKYFCSDPFVSVFKINIQ